MASQDKSVKSFIGTRISSKQFKMFLATAKTPAERKAIKSLCLGPPVQVFAKADVVEDNELKTDLIK